MSVTNDKRNMMGGGVSHFQNCISELLLAGNVFKRLAVENRMRKGMARGRRYHDKRTTIFF